MLNRRAHSVDQRLVAAAPLNVIPSHARNWLLPVIRSRFGPVTNGPEPEYLVEDVLPRAALAVIYGASTSGKTFFAIDIVGAVARGVDWRGFRTRQERVGYIAAEGAGGFRNRLKAYARHNQLEKLDIVVLAGAPNFGEKKDITGLIASMRAWGRMGLIVVDTLAQVTPGANENAGEDMGRVIGHCRTIHEVTGATVILIHHSGKDESKGARGWSGLRAAADAEITRLKDDRVATVTKLKDGEDGAAFGFKLLPVSVSVNRHGDIVSSCVLEHGVAVVKEKKRLAPKGVNEHAAMKLVREMIGPDGTLPVEHEIVARYEAEHPRPKGATGRDLRGQAIKKALGTLAGRGALVRHPMGRYAPPEDANS